MVSIVAIQSYYTIIDYIPYAVVSIPVDLFILYLEVCVSLSSSTYSLPTFLQ